MFVGSLEVCQTSWSFFTWKGLKHIYSVGSMCENNENYADLSELTEQNPLGIVSKLNVHMTVRRRPRSRLNAIYTLHLRLVVLSADEIKLM